MSKANAANAKPTEVEKVTAKFIKEVQDKGLHTTFEWIQGWMDAVARATLLDEIELNYSDFPTKELKREAHDLFLKEIVARGAESVTNLSTSIGHNYMKQARIAEASRLVSRSHVENNAMRARWDNLFAKAKAVKEGRAEEVAITETVAG